MNVIDQVMHPNKYANSPLSPTAKRQRLTTVVPTATGKLKHGALKGLAGVFRPAAEVFVAGIMVVDVFALWLPRVLSALTRGTKNTPLPDTTNPADRAAGYLKRLNWGNAWEETWREVCSGPALFFWPTVLFALARKGFGGRAVELPQTSLEKLTQSLQAQLPNTGTPKQRLSQGWQKLVNHVFAETKTAPASFKQFIQQWGKTLTTLLDSRATHSSKKAYQQALQAHHKKLDNFAIQYNQQTHPNKRFYQYDKLLFTSGGEKPSLVKTNQIANTLTNYYDMLREVAKKATTNKQPLPHQLNKAYQRLVKTKAVYSALSVGVTLAFLFKLVFWAQSNDTYPANRNIPLGQRPNPTNAFLNLLTGRRQQSVVLPRYTEWSS